MLDNADANNKATIEKMLNTSFHCCFKYMFEFRYWYKWFTPKEQLEMILKSKRYEMFNLSTIDPHRILKSLIDALPHTDCYYDIYNGVILTNKVIHRAGVIIKSYYPQLKYIAINIFDYSARHHMMGENKLYLTLFKSLPEVTIGFKILLSENEIDLNDPYEIIAIHKKINDNLIPATRLTYYEDLEYILTLDKPLNFTKADLWIMREVTVDVI